MHSLEHSHPMLNHLPIIVSVIGLLLLVVAMLRRRDDLTRVAFAFFVGGGLAALTT